MEFNSPNRFELPLEFMPSPTVSVQTLGKLTGDRTGPSHVHVVLKICNLDLQGQPVIGGPHDQCFVCFAFSLCQTVNRCNYLVGKPFGTEGFQAPPGVLHYVVQNRNDFLEIGIYSVHHAERMEDIWRAVSIFLSRVGFNGDCYRPIEQVWRTHALP